MPHADHFLTRLDRLSVPNVELALSLYRDHELLRHILTGVTLPDAAERVAIALAESNDGPFIVVTRDGKFVTCLGEGMSPGELPIVTRGQLDGITNRIEVYRQRVAAREKLLGPGGETAELARGLYHRGNDFSREEFVAIASWQPMLARIFFDLALDCGELAVKARQTLAPILKRTDKLRPEWNEKLHEYWKMLFAMGHFAVLAAMGGKTPFDGVIVPKSNRPADSILSGFTMHDGIISVCLKGVYAIARLGKPLLSFYKQQYASATNKYHLRESICCLVGIAARHAKLRAEVKKALLPGPQRPSTSLTKYGHALAGTAFSFIDDLDQSTCGTALMGALLACAMTKSLPENHRYRFADPALVPNDLANSIALTLPMDTSNNTSLLTEMLMFVPVAARAAPENLYLPKDFIDLYRKPWQPKDTLDLLASYVEEIRSPLPKPEGPTRSGPCPCGSGKKYKRCCAE